MSDATAAPGSRRSPAGAPTGPPPVPVLKALDQLRNPYRRTLADPKKLAELRESIRRDGLLDPLHVSARGNVVAGTCRYQVLIDLGWTTCPCVVHPEAADDAAELKLVFAGDTKSDRHVADSAGLLADYRARHGLTWEQAAREFGVSPATASRWKAILDQPAPVLDALRAGRIGLMHVMELKTAHTEARRLDLLRETVERGLTPKALRQLVRGRPGGRKKSVVVQLAGVRVEIAAATPLDAAREAIKAVLFKAIETVLATGAGAEALPRVVAHLSNPKPA